MLINNKNIGFAQETKVLGAIVAVNLLEGTVTLMDENEELHTVDMEDVIELEELGAIGRTYIYEGDVVKVVTTGKVYEIVTLEDGEIAMHLLDKKLERMPKGLGIGFERKQLSSFEGVVELLGNIHELKAKKPTVNFNLAIVRHTENGETTYFYAGNDKDAEKVDLIKVIFLGHNIIKEEEYERKTVSYEEYLEMVADGLLKEVNPMELANYVAGVTYGQKPVSKAQVEIEIDDCCDDDDFDAILDSFDDFEDEDEDYLEEDFCEDCEKHVDDCNCDLW